MARAKAQTSAYKTFDQISGRLDEIIGQVRDKNVSLERSLDLFDEALELGAKAVELVDTTDFTPEEEARMSELAGGGAHVGGDGAAAADGTGEEGGASQDGDVASTGRPEAADAAAPSDDPAAGEADPGERDDGAPAQA